MCQNGKKLGVTDFVSEIKCVENYHDLEKIFVHVIQHGLQGFTVKNIEGQQTEAKRSCSYLVELRK